MANLEGKLSQFGSVVMYTDAKDYLTALNVSMKEIIGVVLDAKSSYLSKYEVIEELRLNLAEDWRVAQVPGTAFNSGSFETILPLLSVDKKIVEIVANNIAEYDLLATYIDELATSQKGAFDPPLKESFLVNGTSVYPTPQSSEKDPRRGARLIVFDEFTKQIKDWLIDNALLYGFTLYQDYGLYYMGLEEIKQITTNDNKVVEVVNRFQETPIPAGEVDLAADTLQKAEDPLPAIPVATPGSYATVETESFLLGGGIDGSNVPDAIEFCPPMNNILNEAVVSSAAGSRQVKDTRGSAVKGKVTFIAALENAFAKLKADGYSVVGLGPIGDNFRSFSGQRKGHINILNARKLWEAGMKWSKNGIEHQPDSPGGSNKPPWVADPCKGYHTQGQAVDIHQGGKYTKGGTTTDFKDDIQNHGPLYSALYDAGIRRISNEWWHWSIGEASHDKNKRFTDHGGDKSNYIQY